MAYREESSRVFVGNLPMDIKEREIDDLFYKYGRIRSIDLKVGPRPPAFAFVEFSDPRDAQDAIRGRDGYDFAGERLRVELSHGPRSGRGGGGGPMGGRSLGPSPHGPSRRTGYRVLVSGLPMSCSWQDLKDHMRRAGDVTFSQVMRDGRNGVLGIIDYATMDDMENALRKLDGSDFRNPYDTARIRVKEDRDGVEGGAAGGGGGSRRSRSRSRSKSRSRSRSRSPKREASRSRSRSRSRSPAAREASRSRSRSRSKSPRREASRSRSPARSASRSPSRD